MRPTPLAGWLPMALGLLLVALGAVWTLQGLGVLGGSLMSGVRAWAVAGPVAAFVGLVLILTGVRARSKRS